MKKFLLLFCMALVAFASNAVEVFENGSLEYEITNSERVAIRGLSSAGKTASSISIPGTVTYNGTKYRVYSIKNNAFLNCTNITTVSMVWGVASIGTSAFQGCTALKEFKMASSVTSLGSSAFDGCTALKKFYHNAFSMLSIPTNSMPSNSGMTLYISPVSATEVSTFQSAAGWSKFATVTKSINCWDGYTGSMNFAVGSGDNNGPDAERNAYLVSVDDGTTSIAPPAYITVSGIKMNFYGIRPSTFKQNTTLTSVDFSNCTNLNLIGQEAFAYCSALTSANIKCKTIGKNAFTRCTNLATVTLQEGVKEIDDYAFSYSKLTSLTLPSTVVNMSNYYLVDHVPTLTEINVSSSNSYFASYSGCLYNKSLKTLYRVPEGKTGSISFSSTTEVIYNYAFFCCKLSSAYLPYGLKTIKDNAFTSCSNMSVVRIPSSVTTLGAGVFPSCTSLTSIYINMSTPPTITLDDMFEGTNEGNIYLYVPYGKIEAYKSAGWTGFKDYNNNNNQAYDFNPSGYTASGASVSGNYFCTVTSTSSTTLLGTTFDGTVKLVRNGIYAGEEYTVPDYVTYNNKKYVVYEIGEYAFYNQTSLKKINLPPHLYRIGYEAFWKSPIEGTLALPYGLYSIGNYAFEETNISRLIVPSSVGSINTSAFYKMSSLTDLVLNGGISDLTNSGRSYSLTDVPSNCRILVPTGKVQQFKNHASWSSRSSYIKAGAYDFIRYTTSTNGARPPENYYNDGYDRYRITITSKASTTYNGTTYDGTCMYVYHPAIASETAFVTEIAEIDRTSGGTRKYLVTAYGDSCFAGSKVTNVEIKAPVKTLGAYCFYNSKFAGSSGAFVIPTTVTSIGEHAFTWCADLKSLRFNHSTIPFSKQIYGGNNTNFECLVPLTTIHNYYSTMASWSNYGSRPKTPQQQLVPYFTAAAATRTLGTVVPVSFTKAGVPEAYIATSYNKNTNELTMQSVTQIAANTGALMCGLTVGNEYILHQPDGTVSSPSVNYLTANSTETTNLANVNVAFSWNNTYKYFHKSTGYMNPGLAYLKLSSSQVGSNEYVYTDLFGQPAQTGDVDGNGNVDGTDLNILINIILGKDQASKYDGRANVDGTGGVDGNDLNALINILLGK